jgi:hypothetical protein
MNIRADAPDEFQECRTWSQWDSLSLEQGRQRVGMAQRYSAWSARTPAEKQSLPAVRARIKPPASKKRETARGIRQGRRSD